MTRTLRVGDIAYTNVLPVTHFLPDITRHLPGVELVPQVPAQLNAAMRKGLIHVGPMSSFAYAENAHLYALLPGLSVSAKGPVGSIFLFHKRPLDEVKRGVVALTNTSATSVALLKILLEGYGGGAPTYLTMAPSLEDMLKRADAALLIGDDAILARRRYGREVAHIDLGEWWHRETGLAMTFAVWAVRRDILDAEPEQVGLLYRALLVSKRFGALRRDAVIRAAQERCGGSRDFWRAYFAGLSHDLGETELRGLKRYVADARRLGLLSGPVSFTLWDPREARPAEWVRGI
ncbi:menaquinone biosynthesis protein [Calditerricola satsumensis]|uniref:Chorismate dehydratase n=1 Tax=Calditerricola satsumensis TaxID=373054 RepID=A0A8J3BCA1_9BACI|nr:menaquinone biosynthesis protein [Calditerricola satsumensis]GGJ93914.1 chorismate dehydratase [Calditerricola satsumensis]